MNDFEDLGSECLLERDDAQIGPLPRDELLAPNLDIGMRPAFLARFVRTTPWRHSLRIGSQNAR